MGWFSGHYKLQNKLVVISGGSQGLGASLAHECVAQGASVVVVARTRSKLEAVVESCKSARINETQTVEYVCADLSKQVQCAGVFEKLSPRVPDIVMCVAGVAIPGLLLEVPPEAFEVSIDSIYKASLYFSVEALRAMSKAPSKDPRHITLCSSVVAFLGFIGYGSYAPLKQAVRGLADILRQECIPHNVKVECVFPGNIDTEGFENEEKTKPAITKKIEGPSDVMDPDQCARLILGRLDAGQQMVHTDTIGWVLNAIMLGSSPRTHGVFLTLLAVVLSIFFPIWGMLTNSEIRTYFKTREVPVEPTKSVEEEEEEDN